MVPSMETRRPENDPKGKLLPGDCGSTGNPIWLDRNQIERARQLYQEHFAGVLFSHLMGLTFLVTIPSIFKTLASTDKSSSKILLFRRYLKTLAEVRRWYEDDITNERSEARKSIARVRKTHYRVASQNNSDAKEPDFLHISQYDMSMAQFAFFGFLVLYPKKMGVWCREYDYKCLAHFWRYVAYLLGIEDRYNLATDSWEETVRNCREVVRDVFGKTIRDAPSEALTMSQGIVVALNSFLCKLRWRAMVAYAQESMEVPRDFKMDLCDWSGYYAGHFINGVLLRFGFCRYLYNSLIKFLIENAIKYTSFYEKRLAKV